MLLLMECANDAVPGNCNPRHMHTLPRHNTRACRRKYLPPHHHHPPRHGIAGTFFGPSNPNNWGVAGKLDALCKGNPTPEVLTRDAFAACVDITHSLRTPMPSKFIRSELFAGCHGRVPLFVRDQVCCLARRVLERQVCAAPPMAPRRKLVRAEVCAAGPSARMTSLRLPCAGTEGRGRARSKGPCSGRAPRGTRASRKSPMALRRFDLTTTSSPASTQVLLKPRGKLTHRLSTHALTHTLTHSRTHSHFDPLTHSLTHHSLTHSTLTDIHPLTHHSLTQALTTRPFALVHGDCHPHNVLWCEQRTPRAHLRLIDFEMVGVGSPAQEMGQWTISHMTPAVRRASEQRLVAGYHAQVVQNLTAKDKQAQAKAFSYDACWSEYVAGGAGRWIWFVPVLAVMLADNPKMGQFF